MLPYHEVRSSQYNDLVKQGVITAVKTRTDTAMDTLAQKVSEHVAAKLQDAPIDIDKLSNKVVAEIMPKLEGKLTALLQEFFKGQTTSVDSSAPSAIPAASIQQPVHQQIEERESSPGNNHSNDLEAEP